MIYKNKDEMSTFELVIFIDCEQDKIYDHLSEPINMIGLQPLLTEIDVLEEKKDKHGVILRPFYIVETFRLLGLPIFRNRVYFTIHLTRPKDELEIHVYSKPGVEIKYTYKFQQLNDEGTQVTQKIQVVKVCKLVENLALNQAKLAQRALLSNLKVRLEKY